MADDVLARIAARESTRAAAVASALGSPGVLAAAERLAGQLLLLPAVRTLADGAVAVAAAGAGLGVGAALAPEIGPLAAIPADLTATLVKTALAKLEDHLVAAAQPQSR